MVLVLVQLLFLPLALVLREQEQLRSLHPLEQQQQVVVEEMIQFHPLEQHQRQAQPVQPKQAQQPLELRRRIPVEV
jgi:hypothetical protein